MPTQKRERKRQGRHARQEYLQAQRRKAKLRRQATMVVIAVALVVGAAMFFSRGDGDNPASDNTTTTVAGAIPKAEPVAGDNKITGDTPCPPADGSAKPTHAFEKAPPMCIDPAKTYVATMHTNQGAIDITLDTAKTPKTANNFVVLSRYHYYDGTALFRTNTGIAIIQGGGPHTQFNDDPGPGYTIPDEGSGFKYTEGDLVMARTNAANSASAQFFFAAGPETSQLDGQGTYVTFGKVTSSMDVVKKIMALHKDDPQAGSPGEGGPGELVVIERITITEK